MGRSLLGEKKWVVFFLLNYSVRKRNNRNKKLQRRVYKKENLGRLVDAHLVIKQNRFMFFDRSRQ